MHQNVHSSLGPTWGTPPPRQLGACCPSVCVSAALRPHAINLVALPVPVSLLQLGQTQGWKVSVEVWWQRRRRWRRSGGATSTMLKVRSADQTGRQEECINSVHRKWVQLGDTPGCLWVCGKSL